jgi:hypothetical protein
MAASEAEDSIDQVKLTVMLGDSSEKFNPRRLTE